MRRYGTLRRTAALATALSLAFAPVAVAGTRYDRMVAKVADMVNDERATTTVNAYGLQLLNVLWEDTGRWLDSSVGPNISDVLMLIQVPLKYRAAAMTMNAPSMSAGAGIAAPMAVAKDDSAQRSRGADVDTAVLGHGPTEGPYTELDGLTIERDARFPVRVTLQFYQATSNGVVSDANVKAMAKQIRKVYGKGDYVGSLVVPTELDRQRPTNWTGVSRAIAVTWRDFPGLVERFAVGAWLPRKQGAGIL